MSARQTAISAVLIIRLIDWRQGDEEVPTQEEDEEPKAQGGTNAAKANSTRAQTDDRERQCVGGVCSSDGESLTS